MVGGNDELSTKSCNSLAVHYKFSISSSLHLLVIIVNCVGTTLFSGFVIHSGLWDYFYSLKINTIWMCNLPFISLPPSVFKNYRYFHFVISMLLFQQYFNILAVFVFLRYAKSKVFVKHLKTMHECRYSTKYYRRNGCRGTKWQGFGQ